MSAASLDDDLASVLTVLIAASLNAEQIGGPEWVGLGRERTRDALRELERRGAVRKQGGGYWTACQRTCARCDQRPHGGAPITIDGETLRWFCAGCWAAEAERVRELVNLD